MHGLIAARIEAQACALQDACKIVKTCLSFNMAVRMPTLLISGHSSMRLQPAEEHAVTALTGQVLQLLQQCSKLTHEILGAHEISVTQIDGYFRMRTGMACASKMLRIRVSDFACLLRVMPLEVPRGCRP